ncbi:hypothetical protein [Gordonia sp. CPCC 205333]|uniref:hypothetical protein n=1 Tax=Gordonia sp. CPCC 205333 TaxID=3140790 RepID=UPI003AF3D4CE
MARRAILLGIVLAMCVSIASCGNNDDTRTDGSGESGSVLPALSKEPREVAPGVTVSLAWLTYGGDENYMDQSYIVATLRNQSESAYKLNRERAYFTVGNERAPASDVLPHEGLSPGFEGKVAWQFDRKWDELSDATLTIEGVRWEGDFTELVKPITAPPSK